MTAIIRLTTVIVGTLIIGITIGQTLEDRHTLLTETIVATQIETRVSPTVQELIEVITRDVPAAEGDQYPCFLDLVHDDRTMPYSAIMAHIERKWAGNACAARDHLEDHGWY
jgi:hypothetical protein